MMLLLMIELPFFLSSLTKFAHGGYFPLLIAAGLVAIMITWHRGRVLIRKKMLLSPSSLEELTKITNVQQTPLRCGTDVIVSFNPDPRYAAAHAFEWIRLHGSLREHVLLLTAVGTAESHVPIEERLKVIQLGPSQWHIIFYYGYMQEIHLPKVLHLAASQLSYEMLSEETFFLLPREMIVEYSGKEMKHWQRVLFGGLSRNMSYAPDYFFIPPSQIIDFTWIMKV